MSRWSLAAVFATAASLAWADGGAVEQAPSSPMDILGAVESPAPWARSSGPTEYGQENLWEYINGAASLFASYHFEAMATAEYEAAGIRGKMAVDLYLLPDELHAYGLYARERPPDAEVEEVGSEAYAVRGAYRLVKGCYYAKLLLAPPPEDAEEHLRAMGTRLAGLLPGTTDPPAALSVFPREGLVPNSLGFVGTDLLGHAFLSNGLLADYDLGGERAARGFVHIAETEEAAAEALAGFEAFLRERGEFDGISVKEGRRVLTGRDPFYGESHIVQSGLVVAGVLGGSDRAKAAGLAEELVSRTAAYLAEE